MSFYLGAWADLFGRKLLFYIFLTAYILKQAIVIVCAYYFDSPKEFLLLSEVPSALSGGFPAWMLAINAFISDISKPEDRAFRYGMLHLATGLGRPLAAPLGAYLLTTGGFVCVFSTSLVGIVLGSILCVWLIRSYTWNPPKKTSTKKRSAFSPLLILDSFKATFKKRPGPNRKYVLILGAITIFTIMPFFGEMTVAYSYVRIRYNWDVKEYSTYSSIVSSVGLVGQAIFIPIIALLRINEAWVMTLVFASTVARHLIKGLASEPWMYYLGAMIDIIGSYAMSINRSMLSCCVAPDELGKVYALLSALDSLIPIGVSQGYTYVFKTFDELPGLIFFISTGISAIALLLSVYILISLKGRKMADVTAEGAGRAEPDEKEEEKGQDNEAFEHSTHF